MLSLSTFQIHSKDSLLFSHRTHRKVLQIPPAIHRVLGVSIKPKSKFIVRKKMVGHGNGPKMSSVGHAPSVSNGWLFR